MFNHDFNSSKVRLKAIKSRKHYVHFNSFNSSKVRLKEFQIHEIRFMTNQFQFL